MNKYALTTIAAIPSAGGQASSLPAEVGKPVTVQMKAPYFDEFDGTAVYVPSLGCFVPAVWPKIEGGDSADENQG